jgi:hypothetical protein
MRWGRGSGIICTIGLKRKSDYKKNGFSAAGLLRGGVYDVDMRKAEKV